MHAVWQELETLVLNIRPNNMSRVIISGSKTQLMCLIICLVECIYTCNVYVYVYVYIHVNITLRSIVRDKLLIFQVVQ